MSDKNLRDGEENLAQQLEDLTKALKDGEIDNITIDDGSIQLVPGYFGCALQLGFKMNSTESVETALDEAINELLNYLPKGTTLHSTKRCAIESLSIPYQLIFHNPNYPSIKEVEFDFVRHGEKLGDKFVQSSLLREIKYTLRH